MLSPAHLDDPQHGIQRVSCVNQLGLDRHHAQGLQRGKVPAQVDRIFFRGYKSAGLTLLLESKEITYIPLRIKMMIAKSSLGCGLDSGKLQLKHEVARARNAAECDRMRWNVLGDNSPPHPPDKLAFERKIAGIRVAGQNHSISSTQAVHWLTQPSSGKELVARVIRRDQHNIEVTAQFTMLKAVVEQVQLGTKFLLGNQAGLKPLLTDDDRHQQFPGDEKRLIAEVTG